MKIFGIGIDLVETARIAQAIERQGEAFLRRVFTENERRYCESHARPHVPYAARWAAKEAVAKAFGTGIGADASLTEIEVQKLATGQPTILLSGTAAAFASQNGIVEVLISLTHTESHAAAYATAIAL